MGMRLHKAMGWAGAHPDRHALHERLWEGPPEGEVARLMERALAAADRVDRIGLSMEQATRRGAPVAGYPSTMNAVVTYAAFTDSDDGMWMIAPPSTCGSWLRSDDSLDYYGIDRDRADWGDGEFRWLPGPPYPYLSSRWYDPATGETVAVDSENPPDPVASPLRRLPPACIRVIAEELGFPDWRALRPAYATWWG